MRQVGKTWFAKALISELKLSAASRGESSILKEYTFDIRSLAPQQATGNALATEFKSPQYLNFDNFFDMKTINKQSCE